jgi:hypothetical protein
MLAKNAVGAPNLFVLPVFLRNGLLYNTRARIMTGDSQEAQ